MQAAVSVGSASHRMLVRRGLTLEYLTLGWNVVGFVVLAMAAISTGSLALAGFGVDSAIEIVASLVVVWQLRGSADAQRERTALRVIAVAFGLLAVYIAVQVTVALASGTHPGHSTTSIVWLTLTICAMLALAAGKRDTGRRLGSAVLTTEARVTVIDGALAAAVLAGVALNAAAGWWWADPVSAVVILFYGVREARHAWRQSG
jgi:divalent metal cation (Fe/Co/Zn/Cd) transporter